MFANAETSSSRKVPSKLVKLPVAKASPVDVENEYELTWALANVKEKSKTKKVKILFMFNK